MIADDGKHTARLLGYAGLIPFYVLAIAALFAGDSAVEQIILLQLAWSAVIASFLGAVHWGLAMASPEISGRRLSHSLMPALAGWAIVVLYVLFSVAWPPVVLFIALFVAVYIHDRGAARTGMAPRWYAVLRAPLTVLTVVALLITLFAAIDI